MKGANLADLALLLPELILVGMALALILAARRIQKTPWVAAGTVLAGLAAALASGWLLSGAPRTGFGGMITVDGYSQFFKILIASALALAALLSVRLSDAEQARSAEYHAMLLLASTGMMFAVSALDLLTLYLGLELMTLCSYILVGITVEKPTSNEAAIKYFLLGSFASALLLYGIALTYGVTGSTDFAAIAGVLATSPLGSNPILLAAISLAVAGLAFKISVVPFHAWTPDAYQGAPTPLAAFISVGPKIAAMALLARILTLAFEPLAANLSVAIAVIASATMIIGNLAAIAQTDIKRMLGYSSIAHSGYMLVGLAAVVESGDGFAFSGLPSVLFYGFVYAFMNFGAFAVAHVVEYQTGSNEISAFRGLARRAAIPAMGMAIFMFSLTGIPPLSGFLGKLYILQSAVEADLAWLAILMVITSVVSAFYYLRVVVNMFMVEPAEADAPAAAGDSATTVVTADTHAAVIATTAGLTLALGIIGGGLLAWAQSAVETGLL